MYRSAKCVRVNDRSLFFPQCKLELNDLFEVPEFYLACVAENYISFVLIPMFCSDGRIFNSVIQLYEELLKR